MKTIGIIGGMSYESTLEYYKIINDKVNEKFGGLHSAKIILESYDFSAIEKLQSQENWDSLTKILIQSAQKLEKFGADYIAIATNTMHLMAQQVQNNISIPLIHIAQASANFLKNKNIDTTLLLGTKYTMSKDFYKNKLIENGIKVTIPNLKQQTIINDIIYQELCKGVIKNESREIILGVVNYYKNMGVKSVILGCTELPLIIKKADLEIVDTTYVHCLEIVNKILDL